MPISERSRDPQFQKLLRRAHPAQWASGERQNMSDDEIARAIIRMLCDVKTDDEASDTHPEVRALVAAFERESVQIAEQCQTLSP